MTRTIEQIWNGNLEPAEHLGRSSREIIQLEKLIARNLEKLETVLNDDQKPFLKRYCDAVDEYALLNYEQAFCEGFCLGARIIAEALIGAEAFL